MKIRSQVPMAKKEKVGSVAAGEDIDHLPGNTIAPPSPPTEQTARPGAPVAAQTAAVPAAQMENAMVRQILERQAVFGF